MNKTVTANIGGMVFHIEVDAYDKLQKYLNTIRSYFKNSEESEEIMADIESRIAELFSPKLSSGNQVIRQKEVDEVILIMGKPEQYIQDEENEKSQQEKRTSGTYVRTKRRLFRDPDDRVLGGVASGVSHYIGLDPIWLRLTFVLMFLFGGSGFLFYIILWIIIPEAKTATDKLQMKGEPVNFENIGKAFEEGAQKVNDKINKVDANGLGEKLEQFFESLFHVLGTLFKGIFKALGKVFGIAIFVVGILLAFSFFGLLGTDSNIYSITSSGIFSLESKDFFLTLFNSEGQYKLAKYTFIVLVGVPILGLILGGVKLLFNVKANTGIGMGLGVLWLIGLGSAIVLGIRLGSEFKSESRVSEYTVIKSNFNEYVLELNEEEVPGESLVYSSDNDFILNIDKSTIYFGLPTLDIKKSFKDSVQLKVEKYSRGSSKRESMDKARSITYSIDQNGELLSFNSYMSFDRQQKIRGQEVQLTLLLPVGTVIYLDESMRDIIYNIDNVTDTWDEDMLGKKWIMLDDGLTCLNCSDIEGVHSEQTYEEAVY